MKQQPTQKEWDKLTSDQKFDFWSNYGLEGIVSASELSIPDIGQMIEFLGEDLVNINNGYNKSNWEVRLIGNKLSDSKWEEELCDALWDAVKYKLNN